LTPKLCGREDEWDEQLLKITLAISSNKEHAVALSDNAKPVYAIRAPGNRWYPRSLGNSAQRQHPPAAQVGQIN